MTTLLSCLQSSSNGAYQKRRDRLYKCRLGRYLCIFNGQLSGSRCYIGQISRGNELEVNKRRMDALLAPYIGLMYALRKIQWCLVLETDLMRRACRAEALCQVVRTEDWRPRDGSSIEVPYVEHESRLL
jgi:hypothetical protein